MKTGVSLKKRLATEEYSSGSEDVHQEGWEELLRGFTFHPWRCDFSPLDEDPPLLDYVMLESALGHLDIRVRNLTPDDVQQDIPMPPGTIMGGLCTGPHEVAVAIPSYSMLAHEGAHALDHRLPGYEWGGLAECVAISVEHLLCFDRVEGWQPDVMYGRHWGVNQRMIKDNKNRIECVYRLIAANLCRARNVLGGIIA